MDLQLKGKVVVITGAGKGIGAATARSFSREGAWVVLVDRDDEALQFQARQMPKSLILCADLTDPKAPQEVIQAVQDQFGALDVLVNNAGVNDAISLEGTPAQFMESLHRNLLHVFSLTHFAREHLIKAEGSIVNVSSKVAETGQGSTSGYAAAKGAINALTREWAVALASKGVRVNAVIPAECDTDQYQRWFASQPNSVKARQDVEKLVPLKRRLTLASEVADAIVFLASPRNGHITGQLIHVDGGYVHLDRSATADRGTWSSPPGPPASRR